MNIFPAIQPAEAGVSTASELPMCREVAWDFERNIPIWRKGEPLIVTGKEAVKVWIWKALKTPRYRQEIYSWDYGSELEDLIGQTFSPALKESEASRYLRECLMTNPYISAVKDITATVQNDTLSVSATVVTIYGEVELNADF